MPVHPVPSHERDASSLTDAFESAGELYAATSPLEAATIAASVLERTVAPDRVSVYLYDVNEDVMRPIAALPASGAANPLSMGEGVGRAFPGAMHRSRTIDATSSTLESLHDDTPDALLVRGVYARGRLRAGIVVARGEGRLSNADAQVVDYVADRLSDVLC